jgi:hypothetical protein
MACYAPSALRSTLDAVNEALRELIGSRWQGKGDPMGNEVTVYPCSIAIEDGVVRYTWEYEGKTHAGSYVLQAGNAGGADFTDCWHSPDAIACAALPGGWGLMSVEGTYAAGHGPRWGWRSTLPVRPSGELVLQMTNVAPSGEHGRAVRMICERAQG